MIEVAGNNSASDHELGSKILSQRSTAAVHQLAEVVDSQTTHQAMLDEVYLSNIPWLKVSVGSEMAVLLKPELFWVANSRTVWAHLLVKHNFDYTLANEELQLYRDDDQTSLMAYKKWVSIYLEMGSSVVALSALGDEEARSQAVRPGRLINLWFDAISNALYEYNKNRS